MAGLLNLAAVATHTDGVSPFNEATVIALHDGLGFRVREDHGLSGALALGDAPVEFVVHPDHRHQGRGAAMLRHLLDIGETRFWAHGDLPGAQALASSAGMTAARSLLVLRATLDTPPAWANPAGTDIRPFTDDDVDAILAVNARAFADHPEQGAMDRVDFDRRRAETWFRRSGLFVAERDGRVVGFHWTKIEDGIGEVYVIGVDPDAHGGGLGTSLLKRGLRHLWDLGIRTVDLYVEADNAPALGLYAKLGFAEHARDTLYELAAAKRDGS